MSGSIQASSSKNSPRPWLLLCALAVTGTGVALCWRVTSPDKAARSPATASVALSAEPLSQTARELSLLRTQLHALMSAVSQQSAELAAQQVALKDVRRNTELPEPTQVARSKPLTAVEAQGKYAELVTLEARDARWARTEEQTLREAATASPGTRVTNVDCRASMCRLDLEFDSQVVASQFRERIGSAPFDKGAFWSADPETGKLVVITAREGRRLPDLSTTEVP